MWRIYQIRRSIAVFVATVLCAGLEVLKDADIRISMDGRGRWMDNVFIERSRFAGKAGGLAKVDSGLDYAANFSS